jgi:hypothetical protein
MSRLRLGPIALYLLLALPAHAQEQVEVYTNVFGAGARLTNVDGTVRGFGGVLADTPLTHVPTDFLNNAAPVAGGRYLGWLAGSAAHPGQDLFLFDRRTRAVVTATSSLPQPGADARFPSYFQILGADTHRARLFVSEFRSSISGPSYFVWTIDLTGKPPVALGATSTSSPGFGYAAETDEVFINSWGGTATTIVVVNATTGAEVRRITHPLASYGTLTEPGGRVVWVNDGNGMNTLDARTGAVLATSPYFQTGLATYDSARGILLVRQSDFLVVVDPLRLTEIGRARVAFSPFTYLLAQSTQTLPGRWMTGAYVLRSSYRYGNAACNEITLESLDTTGAIRATKDLLAELGPGGNGCIAVGFLFRSPFAPTALTTSVSGGTVQLAWKDPGDTTEFELEFGFAPGQRAGAIRVGTATRLTLPGVPPGTYYVRVRALNEVGPSPASSDIRVVVP